MILDSVASNNVLFSENHGSYCFLIHEESLTINMQKKKSSVHLVFHKTVLKIHPVRHENTNTSPWCNYVICEYSNTWMPYLFANVTFSLSSLCRLIRRHRTYKMLVKYSLCLRLCQFPQPSLMWYMGPCVFNLPISVLLIVRICVHIIINSEVWTINYCLGSWNNGMRFITCIVLMKNTCLIVPISNFLLAVNI